MGLIFANINETVTISVEIKELEFKDFQTIYLINFLL